MTHDLTPETVALVDGLQLRSRILAPERSWWWPLLLRLSQEGLVLIRQENERGISSARIAWTQAGAEAARPVRGDSP